MLDDLGYGLTMEGMGVLSLVGKMSLAASHVSWRDADFL